MNSALSHASPTIFTVRFLGTGNAFAQGGKGYQAIHVTSPELTFLVDCGPTVQLIANQQGIDLSTLDAIFFTHVHGDHAFGLPFILLQMQFLGLRTRPLTIVVPTGHEEFPDQALKLAFPDVHRMGLDFPIEIRTLDPADGPVAFSNLTVQAFPMVHSVPVNGLKFDCGGVVLAISGDTTLCESIFDLSHAADLLILECSSKDHSPETPHISHEELLQLAPKLNVKRLVVVHTDGLFDPDPFYAPRDGEVLQLP
ncbi:MAG: MBL fold metallo-hydrolase [Bradymonadales bacterium]|nr:MBL fold metallo-hydrolase [Bradymonadales bacterium]